MVDWLGLERERAEEYNTIVGAMREAQRQSGGDIGAYLDHAAEYDRLTAEIARLTTDLARQNPPALDTNGRLTIDPLATRNYDIRIFWLDRIDQLKAHQKWTGTTDHAKTIAANLDQFLDTKKQQAESGQIAFGWFSVLRFHLDHFRQFTGETAVENLNATLLGQYHSHLLAEVQAKKITNTYAKQLLASTKQFVRWLWENEVIDNLPRNLSKLNITADAPTIETIPPQEITTLLTAATDRTRLYILLCLNCGYTGQDIADLKPSEVDWKTGRIIRKRSKTMREKSVPIVDYKLWGETFRLLKKHGNRQGERVFLNNNGQPLRRWEENDNGKVRNQDNVSEAWARLTDKPLKLLRKTAASLLATHPTYGQFAFLFLGHSPKTTAEKHYVQVPQQLFDEAMEWLGKELDIE